MGREYVTALKESLEKKLKVLEELYRLCLSQSELLNKEELDYEAFDTLVDEKDICIEKLEKLDEGFEIVYNRVKPELESNKAMYAAEIKAMQELIVKITDKSTSITALEERNKKGVTATLKRDKKGLSESKRSVSVAMNYYKSMNGINVPDSQYLDKKK